MAPILLIPTAVFGFLGGISLGKSRRGLSMLPPERPSPLPGVSALAWQRFVTIMVVAPRGHVTPRRRMGLFGMDGRRLADVGFMANPRKVTVGAEAGVWSGEDWVPVGEKLTMVAPVPSLLGMLLKTAALKLETSTSPGPIMPPDGKPSGTKATP